MTTRVGVTAARATLIACMAAMPLPTLALGLGELEMQSFLNEPLRAELALLDTRDLTPDDIRIRLAGVEDFERLGVDRSFFLTGIQFEIDLKPAAGRGVIRLSTQEAVLEPYLDIIVEARWPNGRVLREYTVLVDPPTFRDEMITVSASERVEDLNPDKPALADESRAAMQPDAGSGQTAAPVVESTGDRVALRQSSLPPGEMPERPFSAQTSDTPVAGRRYMVKRDETLWQIAARGRPEDISVQQAMLDIQRINPEAFIDGNINRIKAGYIIYLPAPGEVASDDLMAALEEVRAQNRAFEAERSLPGVSAAATLRVSADPQSSGAADADAAQGPAAPAMDSAAAGAEETGSVAGVEGVPSDKAAGEPMAVDGASDALAAELAAMSARLDTLEQIVSLKDEQIATLEKALREAREDAAAAAARADTAPPPQQPAPTGPAPAPRPEVPWIPALGGLLVLLLVLVLFLRRRGSRARPLPEVPAARAAQRKNEDVFAGVSLKKEAFADTPEVRPGIDTAAAAGALLDEALDDEDRDGGGAGESELAPGGSRGYGESRNDDYIDDGSASDALAEADIYIAYGRYLQAVELLNTAIDAEPGNSAYRLKLIELYVDMGEGAKAADQLTALRAQGDPEAIERGEALVGGAAAPVRASETAPLNATSEARPSVAAASGESMEAAVTQRMPGRTPGDEGDSGLDTREAFAAPEPPVLESGAHPGNDAAARDRDAPVVPGEQSLELDLDLAEDETPAVAGPDAGDADDWVPEFDQLEIESAGGEAEAAPTEPEEVLDLTDALADFEGADYQDDGDEDDENEFMIADDADQMATKLDLARAYLDMGDSDGARTILREVAGSGSAEQQQEARELLSRIG